MSAPLAIETRKLTKRFGAFVAVDGLDLTVEEGEVFVGGSSADFRFPEGIENLAVHPRVKLLGRSLRVYAYVHGWIFAFGAVAVC